MARRSQIVISKVYTRTGDKGTTGLVGGARVPKDDPRIEAYGTVDELNAVLGMAVMTAIDPLRATLLRIQNELFDLGSELATPVEAFAVGMPSVEDTQIRWMEQQMDEMNKGLEPLKSFVLPGGGPTGAVLHLARTVCRRAEREVLRLSRLEKLRPQPLKYLNRLSDLLFVMSRQAARQEGHPETLWQPVATRS
ncbi:MAG TPA: cob(I)yrinic acid a,c-diamide adenosyltransferase [Candidatus Xenobia bacterium]|jgi:cob(I)alamin adenosyltransferase